MQYQPKWYIKFFDVFISTVLVLQLPLLLLELISSWLPQWLSDFIYNNRLPDLLFNWFAPFGLLFAIVYSYYWHRQEIKKDNFPSEKKHAFFLAAIRYTVATMLMYFAFSKLFGVQFQTEYYREDTKISELNGLRLTWFYFGYSHTFRAILGYIQLIGSIFLFFRRTTLLGVFILLPLIINILFVNLFYDIGIRPLSDSLIITAGLAYILLLHWEKIAHLLFYSAYPVSVSKNNYIKNAVRLCLLLIVFAIEYQYHLEGVRDYAQPDSIIGKWKVNKQMVNGKMIPENAWKNDTTGSVWSNLYFEHAGMCAVSGNPYYFTTGSGMEGGYSYNPGNRQLEIDFDVKEGQVEIFKATLDHLQADSLYLKGVYKKDTISLYLSRVKNIHHRIY